MEIIDLEMIPGGPKKTCHASQFDNGRVIRFNLKENGQPFALSGTETVQAIIRKPDGSETTLDIANTSSTYVDLITEADTCDLAGVNHCEMKVTEDGEGLGSGNFDMKVEEDAYGGGDVSVGTASGPIASFETDIKDELIECKGDISYRAEGYKQATFINSRSMPQKDMEPYLFRTAGGSLQNIGGQEYDTLVGASCVFNQLIRNGNFESTSGWGTSNYTQVASDNIMTITKNGNGYALLRELHFTIGHKLLKIMSLKGVSGITYYTNGQFLNHVASGAWETLNRISIISSELNYFTFSTNEASDYQPCYVKNLMFIDLTQMFGSTIADYIYNLEQATAGAGVAWLKNHGFMTKPYYPYNAGELISVKTSAHIMRDAANNIIGNYTLDSDLELRGIPKLDSNNRLVFDGDEYADNGAVERRYKKIDLNTQAWNNLTSASNYAYIMLNDRKEGADNKFIANIPGSILRTRMDSANQGFVLEFETGTFSSTEELKTALANSKLVYELATPTAETAAPFTNPQAVSKYGTEEYIDGRTVEMPVGHSTIYGDDIQAKRATFPERIYGGEINMTTGELTSTKNADGTDKATPDTYQLTPKNFEARSGQNNIMNDTNGDTAVKFYTRA